MKYILLKKQALDQPELSPLYAKVSLASYFCTSGWWTKNRVMGFSAEFTAFVYGGETKILTSKSPPIALHYIMEQKTGK